MRCGKCGNKELKKVSTKGKSFPWKDFPSVLISIDELSLYECSDCGEIRLSARQNEIEKLDEVLKNSIRHQIGLFVDIIKREGRISQKDLCVAIGVTPQHLSNIKNGSKEPSFQLYNFLKMLAENPEMIGHLSAQHIPDFLKEAVG